jgi:glycosyltransferase involved in cell wall biosynthesis
VISQGGRLSDVLEREMGVAADRIRVLPNSVAESALSATRPRRAGRLRLLYVGRDEPRKGLRILLDAVAGLDDVELAIVGPPAPGSPTLANVTWHGPIRDRDRMLSLYDEAHVFALPSFAEGFPTVVLEAMARGLPVIGSDVGAVAEAVVPGRTGWLVPSGDVQALQRAIREASALTADDYEALSASAQGAVRSRFVRGRVCEELLKILRSVVQR